MTGKKKIKNTGRKDSHANKFCQGEAEKKRALKRREKV